MSNQYLRLTLLALSILALVASFALELRYIMNYLQKANFWWMSFAGIALISMVGIFWLSKKSQWTTSDSTQKMQLSLMTIITAGMLVPLLLSSLNRRALTGEIATKTVVFESVQGRYGSRFGKVGSQAVKADHYLLFFFYEGQLRKHKQLHDPQLALSAGDELELPIQQGRLGWDWVEVDKQ